MNTDDVFQKAASNFKHHLEDNPYPGRGLVLGCDPNGDFLLLYWIMGRSENSRNRVFTLFDEGLRTEAADPSRLEDPSLIIYNAVCRTHRGFLVTNGDHTDRIHQSLMQGGSFQDSLLTERHEPDSPNYTPRIVGLLDLSSTPPCAELGIIRRSVFSAKLSEHRVFHFPELKPGYGFGITTYQGDGNPLPAFDGPPMLMPLDDGAEQLSVRYWDALDPHNRVALAVMSISSDDAAPFWKICNSRNRVLENKD